MLENHVAGAQANQAEPRSSTASEVVAALHVALAYVEKVANTNPTTPSRMQTKLAAQKDAEKIRAVLRKARGEQ